MRGKHQSITADLKKSIRWLESIEGVTKIVIGLSEACRHKYPPGHLRFKSDANGGIKINAYSGNGVVNMFIRIDPISERDAIKAKIAEQFKS
jgi:hypothetical protein